MPSLSGLVDALADNGAGIIKSEDKVYFVDQVIPGEQVEFTPIKKHKGKFRGQLTRVIQPSPDRAEPRCEYFGVCGGCALQHITPAAQLTLKQARLFDNLSNLANATPQHRLTPLASPDAEYGYRRKARVGVRYVPKKGGVLVGFRERGSRYLTSLMHCHTLDPRLAELLPALHALLEQISIRTEIPQLEISAADNAVAIVLRNLQPFNQDDIALTKQFAIDHKLHFFLQPRGLDSVTPLYPESPPPLYYRLPDYDVEIRFKPTDFIQVNATLNQAMINAVLELLRPESSDLILDLFCGLGNFTLPIARSGATVLGVEGDAGLVERARQNALLNQLPNATFQHVDLYQSTLDTKFLTGSFDKVILDPPRSGAALVIERIIPHLMPRTIVYVSCNPVTLAQDADSLIRLHGYRLTHAGVVDMFPHTAQTEAIACFKRSEVPAPDPVKAGAGTS